MRTEPAHNASDLRSFRYLDKLIVVFVTVLLVSNIVAPKLVAVGPFLFSGAQLLFPITYIFGDVFTEVYGYAASRRAIWSGFFASALLSALSAIIIALPPAPEWNGQAAYQEVLGMTPRIFIASLAAYWAGEFANSFVLARLKIATSGRYLWMRTIGSTMVGQAVDTAIVMTIAFAGIYSAANIARLILSGYLFKVIYEAAATPVTYMVVNTLKRREGADILDTDTNFNPFATG
ncbi:MAG TPA: queuosine precursor transporter [Bryobacteraceae bacterium]|nr:queuosine precursor transporter [Bryobacteraceae bacterium]